MADQSLSSGWGRPVLPREHGAWAMLLVPFAAGTAIGGATLVHLSLAVAVAALYLALASQLEALRAHGNAAGRARRWRLLYTAVGAAALLWPLALCWQLVPIGLAAGLAVPMELHYLRRLRERALLNGAVSVMALCCTGLASYTLGRGALDVRGLLLWALCVAHFWGSLLFVRSMIRRRGQAGFAWVVRAYHVATLTMLLALGAPVVALSFALSLLRALGLTGRRVRPAHLGAIEGANSLVFLLLATVGL